MLGISFITVGKLKEDYWKEAEAEYLKRIKPFARFNIHELREESFSDKEPRDFILRKEGEKLELALQRLGPARIIALDVGGANYTSEGLALRLNEWRSNAEDVAFVIGGPLGLDKTVLGQAHETLSISPLTFTHQMARVILLEQIYRGMMILANRKYHY